MREGYTPLTDAARYGRADDVTALITNGVDVNEPTKDGYETSALWFACYHGHTTIVKALLGANASVAREFSLGGTPLCAACHQGHAEVVSVLLGHEAAKLLIEKGASVDALICAACHGHEAVVKLLIEKGVSVDAADQDVEVVSPHGGCRTALIWAAMKGHAAVAKVLWLAEGRGRRGSSTRSAARPPGLRPFGRGGRRRRGL